MNETEDMTDDEKLKLVEGYYRLSMTLAKLLILSCVCNALAALKIGGVL